MQFTQASLLRHHIREIHDNESGHAFTEELNGKTLINGIFEETDGQLEMEAADMKHFVSIQLEFSNCSASVHHFKDIPLLQLFNRENRHSTAQVSHGVFPPCGLHSLIHWKILAILLKVTTGDQENLIHFQHELIPPPLKICKLIDSHFHLGTYLKQTRCSGLTELFWENEQGSMTITNLVANYCFPRNWRGSHQRGGGIRKDQRLRLTFGIVDLESSRDEGKWLSDLEVVLSAK